MADIVGDIVDKKITNLLKPKNIKNWLSPKSRIL